MFIENSADIDQIYNVEEEEISEASTGRIHCHSLCLPNSLGIFLNGNHSPQNYWHKYHCSIICSLFSVVNKVIYSIIKISFLLRYVNNELPLNFDLYINKQKTLLYLIKICVFAHCNAIEFVDTILAEVTMKYDLMFFAIPFVR